MAGFDRRGNELMVRAYPHYGSKANHLGWLLPQLDVECRHFVDLFAGSGVVLLNRRPSPNETLNDLNGDAVNVFRQLRENGPGLMDYLSLVPYSHEEWHRARCAVDETDPFMRAVNFLVDANMSIQPPLGGFALSRDESRRGMTKHVSDWLGTIDGLPAVIARLKTVNLSAYPALELIRKLDAPGTLFYADPPYVKETRRKRHVYGPYEMSDDEHRELGAALRACKGKVLVSGFDCPLYDELYEGWHKESFNYTVYREGDKSEVRVETVWRNYEPPAKLL